MSQPRNGLGVLSHDQTTFIITLKVLSTFTWAELSGCYLREFPGGNPQSNDFRSRFSRQLRDHPVRRSLENQLPLGAADQSRVALYLQRYVPDDRLSPQGRTFNGVPTGAGSGAVSAHVSGSQTTSSAPAPGPSVPAVPQGPNGQAPTTSSDNDDSVFGWVFPAVDPGSGEQQAPDQELPVQESHVSEGQPESYQSIYPSPELYELGKSRTLAEMYVDLGKPYDSD